MTATSKAVEDATASAVLAAARRIARRLGNPAPALTWTLQAGQRLLSMATALPESAPDPYAALRGLLQPQVSTVRGAPRRERTQPSEPPATPQMRRATAAHRDKAAAPPTTRRMDTGPVSAGPVSAGPAAATPLSTAPAQSTAPVREASATTQQAATARSTVSSITPTVPSAQAHRTPLQLHALAAAASSVAAHTATQPAQASQHPLASGAALAQRRRRLRDRLDSRTPGAAVPAPLDDPGSIATPAALLAATSAPSEGTVCDSAPRVVRVPRVEPVVPQMRVPAPSSLGSNQHAAAPSSSVSPQGMNSSARAATSVRRLLPPISPLDTFGDIPANTLLDAAHRHGVDPA